MGVLSSLKLISAKRPSALTGVQVRRNKLCSKLHDQIQLAKAMADGSTYAPKRLRNVRDSVSGEIKQIEVAKRVRPWFFTADSGKAVIQIRYGSKVIDFAKGKNSVEVANGTELISVFEILKKAVEAGELDAQIEAAADVVKARFVK